MSVLVVLCVLICWQEMDKVEEVQMSTNTEVDTGPDKMVQLVMEDMWRVEGGPWISTLQLVRWSRLTSLASTCSLVRTIVWSVRLDREQELELEYPGTASTTERLEMSGAVEGAETAVLCLHFLKPNFFFGFTCSCISWNWVFRLLIVFWDFLTS